MICFMVVKSYHKKIIIKTRKNFKTLRSIANHFKVTGTTLSNLKLYIDQYEQANLRNCINIRPIMFHVEHYGSE